MNRASRRPSLRRPHAWAGLACTLIAGTAAGAISFYPDMAKREAPGPFAAAPIVQGEVDGTPGDLLQVDDDPQISGQFFERFDANQGTIVFWITPQWNGSDGVQLRIFSAGSNLFVVRKTAGAAIQFETSGADPINLSADISSWAAGTTHNVVIRWDAKNTLDGTNYASITIDGVHTFGDTSVTLDSWVGRLQIGSRNASGSGSLAANAIIEGLTIYRRPLFDGAAGVDLGNGDEISQIYNAGAGADPAEITGSWDIVLALPTNSLPGQLVAGTGEAWTHPHLSQLIPGNANKGGLMLDGTPSTDGWSNEGTPTSVSALTAAQKIFSGGYQFTVDAAGEGIYQDVTVAPGDDWVVRALAHSDGACQPKVILYDQTNGAEIGSLSGATTSTRTAPDVLILTGEAPAGSTTLRVKLVNAVSSGTCHWHQVELLPNLLSNPSLESGSGDPWIPTDWTNQALGPGESAQELTTVHSGASSIKILAPGGDSDFDSIRQAHSDVVEDDFYCLGGFLYWVAGDAPAVFITNGRLIRQSTLESKVSQKVATMNAWEHVTAVGRRDDDPPFTSFDNVIYGNQHNEAADHYFDDAYVFHLTNVSVELVPASLTDSTENTTEIRVDGWDRYVAGDTQGLGTTSGSISFNWRPRHDPLNAVAFAEVSSGYILTLFGDADDFIRLFWDSPDSIRLRYSMAGTTGTMTWKPNGAIVAGTLYTLEVAYTGGGDMTFKVDGVTRITLSSIPAGFGEAPDTAFYGSDETGGQQGDAAFSSVATAVRLSSFTALGLDAAVELSWMTGSEIDNLGFHVYRSARVGEPGERVTTALVPGLGSSAVGAMYRYVDSGLANGNTYYYWLEDVEMGGKTTLHGPVSATPLDGGPLDSAAPGARITYGNPEASSLRVLSRTARETILELRTEGFYAEPREDGTFAVRVPDFFVDPEPRQLALPVRRTWVEVPGDLGVRIASVSEEEAARFSGLRPSVAGEREVVVSERGTVRAARSVLPGKAPRQTGSSRGAERSVRLVEVGFQREVKKAHLALAPFRWDEARGELVLSRRLRVRLVFTGEPGRRASSRGARSIEGKSVGARGVLARLSVRDRGLYRVRYEEVFGPAGRQILEASSIRLSRLGEPVAFHLQPQRDRFAPGSALYFVSEGESSNPYENKAVYELALSGGGLRMGVRSAPPTGEVTSFYRQALEREENRLYLAALLEAPDPWLWDSLFAPVRKTYRFDALALAEVPEPSRLELWLQGASQSSAAGDHHVRVFVNGSPVAETIWDGKLPHVIDATLGPGLLREGENALEIENAGDTDAPYSMVMLDRFRVTYPRRPVAEAGVLEGEWRRSGRARIAGVASGAYVLDVTDEHPQWLSPVETLPDGVSFSTEAGGRYLVVSPEALLEPQVSRAGTSSLRSTRNQADYLLLGPRAFLEIAAPLVELRRSQGLRALPVALEDVYSEFGFGESRPEAIREFLSYAYHAWRPPSPRYVLLLGDASYDFKDTLRTGAPNVLPPLMVKTSYVWTVSDPGYAAVHGEDLLPDLAIGRLPAASADEARTMVEKILAYESREDAPVSFVLVADDPDAAGNFEADADEIAETLLSSYPLTRIDLGRLGVTAARSAVVQAFDEGAFLMSYLGHGAIQLWADENLFHTGQVRDLAPQPRLPILLTLNCLNGYFHFPYFASLAESLVEAEGKGAIAAFSPSGFSLNGPAHVLHKALLREILHGSHPRLGDAILAGQAAYAETAAFPELLAIYHLLGDPAMKLKTPPASKTSSTGSPD